MISLELPPTSIHKLTSLKTHRILHSLHTDMAASSLKYSITTREHVLLLKWFHPIFSRTRIVFFICSNTKCKHQCLISAKLDKVETSKTNCQLQSQTKPHSLQYLGCPGSNIVYLNNIYLVG